MKKTHLWLIVILLAFPMHSVFLLAQTSVTGPSLGPINPAFLEYQEKLRSGTYPMFSSEGHPLGYIPPPAYLAGYQGVVDPSVMQSYPSSYDLRAQGKLTAVRNQGQCGDCWAFAAMAVLESFLMPGETRDFSEQDLNLNKGFDYPVCHGGNEIMTAAYLLRWDGPLNESDVPYPYSVSAQESSFPVQKHVQQVIYLPSRANFLDNDTIKYFIMNYGAVEAGYYTTDSNYNFTYNSYYYSGSSTNHMISLVGWDDNFPASHFKTPPPGDGAFIVRNSWGTSWGDSGYFYLSYYSAPLGNLTSYNVVEPTSKYEQVYQYDPLGCVGFYGWPDTTCWGANIFTAQDNLYLKAVGFYLLDSNASYTIYIYRGVTSGQPMSGTLVASKSGTKQYSGFYTEELASPVQLNSGTLFSVVIRFTNSTKANPLAIEMPMANYSSQASASSGQSFISHDGSYWWDIPQQPGCSNTNACIKAYLSSSSTNSRADLNADGVVNATDLSLMADYLAGNIRVLPCGLSCGDVNQDGNKNILDLMTVLRSLAVG